MLITLVFNDAVKEYDIDVKAFPTIADYVESCNSTTMIIPEYFNSSSMDWLIDILKNNEIKEYSYSADLYDIDASRELYRYENYRTVQSYASDEYINVNYLDMIFAEFMGINLFEITISNGNKQITVDLENISAPKFGAGQVVAYDNNIYVGNYKCDCHGIVEVSGVAVSKIEKYPIMNKRYSCIHVKTDSDLFYKFPNYYCYRSTINIVWENVDWTIIEKFYNSKSVRSSLSLTTVMITGDDDDITVAAKINIINKLKEEEYTQDANNFGF